MVKFKSMSTEFERIRSGVKSRISSFPILTQALRKVRSSQVGVFVADQTQKSLEHAELMLKDFPRDRESIRPYIHAQQNHLRTWSRDLFKMSDRVSNIKKKKKRSRTAVHAKMKR